MGEYILNRPHPLYSFGVFLGRERVATVALYFSCDCKVEHGGNDTFYKFITEKPVFGDLVARRYKPACSGGEAFYELDAKIGAKEATLKALNGCTIQFDGVHPFVGNICLSCLKNGIIASNFPIFLFVGILVFLLSFCILYIIWFSYDNCV